MVICLNDCRCDSFGRLLHLFSDEAGEEVAVKNSRMNVASLERNEAHGQSGNEKPQLWLRVFIVSAGCVLLVTGLAKVASAFGKAPILSMQDPILGVPFRELMGATGVLELAAAVVCFVGRLPTLSLALVAWLSTAFAFYRLGLWYVGWHGPCPCLGSLTSVLPASPDTVQTALTVLLVYLILGSYGSFCISRYRHSSKAVEKAGGYENVVETS